MGRKGPDGADATDGSMGYQQLRQSHAPIGRLYPIRPFFVPSALCNPDQAIPSKTPFGKGAEQAQTTGVLRARRLGW